MAALVTCLVGLRSEINLLAPGRDKTSDGWIGDAAHQASRSDHNPDSRGLVHAVDLDVDLRTSGLDMEKVVQHVLLRCRSGAEKRLRYVIYNRRIWEASNGWRQRAYGGANPHDKHAHFSASYDPRLEASTASWRLEDIPVALTEADKSWFRSELRAAVKTEVDARVRAMETTLLAKLPAEVAKDVLDEHRFAWSADKPGQPNQYTRNLADLVGDPWTIALKGTTRGGDPIPASGAFGQILAAVTALRAEVAELKSQLPAA